MPVTNWHKEHYFHTSITRTTCYDIKCHETTCLVKTYPEDFLQVRLNTATQTNSMKVPFDKNTNGKYLTVSSCILITSRYTPSHSSHLTLTVMQIFLPPSDCEFVNRWDCKFYYLAVCDFLIAIMILHVHHFSSGYIIDIIIIKTAITLKTKYTW